MDFVCNCWAGQLRRLTEVAGQNSASAEPWYLYLQNLPYPVPRYGRKEPSLSFGRKDWETTGIMGINMPSLAFIRHA